MANEQQTILIRSFEIGGILFFAWALMLLIFVLLDVFIVPMQSLDGIIPLLIGSIKVGVAVIAFFVWLFIWRTIIERYFWKRITLESNEEV
ncbi:MAG: hypothetical protein ACFFCQ_03600 [Promethearchaeota archaeon]